MQQWIKGLLIAGMLISFGGSTAIPAMAAKKQEKQKVHELGLIVDSKFPRPLQLYAPVKTPLRLWVANPGTEPVTIRLKDKKIYSTEILAGDVQTLDIPGLANGSYRILVRRKGEARHRVCKLTVSKQNESAENRIALIATEKGLRPRITTLLAGKPTSIYTVAMDNPPKSWTIGGDLVPLDFSKKRKVLLLQTKEGLPAGKHVTGDPERGAANAQGYVVAE